MAWGLLVECTKYMDTLESELFFTTAYDLWRLYSQQKLPHCNAFGVGNWTPAPHAPRPIKHLANRASPACYRSVPILTRTVLYQMQKTNGKMGMYPVTVTMAILSSHYFTILDLCTYTGRSLGGHSQQRPPSLIRPQLFALLPSCIYFSLSPKTTPLMWPWFLGNLLEGCNCINPTESSDMINTDHVSHPEKANNLLYRPLNTIRGSCVLFCIIALHKNINILWSSIITTFHFVNPNSDMRQCVLVGSRPV